jgi:hypothetical protein
VCPSHGGASPQVRAAADHRQEELAVITSIRRTLGVSGPVENPLTEILRLAGEACDWLAALRNRTQARLDSGQLDQWSETGRPWQSRSSSTSGH